MKELNMDRPNSGGNLFSALKNEEDIEDVADI